MFLYFRFHDETEIVAHNQMQHRHLKMQSQQINSHKSSKEKI